MVSNAPYIGTSKKQKLTITIASQNNCAKFQLAPVYESYRSFCMQAEISEKDQDETLCQLAETPFDKETKLFVLYCPVSTKWAICKEKMSFALN